MQRQNQNQTPKRKGCLHSGCRAWASPANTGYCSYHDSMGIEIGQRPGDYKDWCQYLGCRSKSRKNSEYCIQHEEELYNKAIELTDEELGRQVREQREREAEERQAAKQMERKPEEQKRTVPSAPTEPITCDECGGQDGLHSDFCKNKPRKVSRREVHEAGL